MPTIEPILIQTDQEVPNLQENRRFPRMAHKNPNPMHITEQVNPKELITRLESHWQSHFQPRVLHAEIVESLHRLKEELARDSDDARLVLHVYEHWLHGQARTEDLERANQALEHIVTDLGLFILGALPLGFLTLPAVFALAHHFGVDLVSRSPGKEDTNAQSDPDEIKEQPP